MNSKIEKNVNLKLILIQSIFLFVMDAALFTLSIILVTYKTQLLISVLSIILVIILTSLSLFLLLVVYIPNIKYKKWQKRLKSFEKITIQGTLVDVDENITLKDVGLCTKFTIENDGQKIIKFVPKSILKDKSLNIGNKYQFTFADIMIIEITDVENEK